MKKNKSYGRRLVVDDLNWIFQGERLPALIGGMDRQTPDVRYQLLMLMQYLSEPDEEKFLEACRDLLEAANIRYYFRCCAFEVLGQVPNPNRKHWELLSNYFEKPEWHAQIIRTIFLCYPAFIRLLRNNALVIPGTNLKEGIACGPLFKLIQNSYGRFFKMSEQAPCRLMNCTIS